MQPSFGLESGDEPVAQALPDSGKEPLTQTSIETLDGMLKICCTTEMITIVAHKANM